MADWIPLPRSQWDKLRVPIPGFTPKAAGASYTISLAGVIRRIDGLIWHPRCEVASSGVPRSALVRLGGGAKVYSMAKLMHETFAATPDLPTDDPARPGKTAKWIPWLRYDAPFDPLTEQRSCSIDDIVLAPFGQVLRFTRYACDEVSPPETRPFVAIGRDVPIPIELLARAGYKLHTKHAILHDAEGVHRISRDHIS